MILDLPERFREACHWALFVRAVAPRGLPSAEIPRHAPQEVRLEMAKQIGPLMQIRKMLFPDG